jgi:hypothetical protein
MKQVRLTVSLSGSEFALAPGDVHAFASDEADRLIAAGFAVPLSPQDTAAEGKPETTESPIARQREKAVARKAR